MMNRVFRRRHRTNASSASSPAPAPAAHEPDAVHEHEHEPTHEHKHVQHEHEHEHDAPLAHARATEVVDRPATRVLDPHEVVCPVCGAGVDVLCAGGKTHAQRATAAALGD